MDHESDAERDRLDAWHRAAGAWRPHSIAPVDEPLPRGQRAGVAVLLAASHLVAIWALIVGSRIAPEPVADTVTTIVFLAPPAPSTATVVERPRVPEPPIAARDATRSPAAAEARTKPPAIAAESPSADTPSTDTPHVTDEWAAEPGAMVAVESPAPSPLHLYDADGSIALPDDVVDGLAAVDADSRPFEFRMPGLVESGRFLDRPPALAYESTRFDQYWIPEKGALTRILEKAVEATTGTVEIPIPGTRGGFLVCSVSILALGGGCGVRNNSDGYVVRGDDPSTLSPEEDAQCRAWWDQIVGARDQDAWRHTRALYDSACRKPLAEKRSPA